MESNTPIKLTQHLQTFSERVKIAQQGRRKDLVIDIDLATAMLSDIVKLLSLNAELHQLYLEQLVVQVELDGGKF